MPIGTQRHKIRGLKFLFGLSRGAHQTSWVSFVLLFIFFHIALTVGADPLYGLVKETAVAQRGAPKKLVVRFRSESGTGLGHNQGRALAAQLTPLPGDLKKLHNRWGVRTVTRVQGPGSSLQKKNKRRAARAPLDGPARARTLANHLRRTTILELPPNTDLAKALKDYRADTDVEWAEPVRVMEIFTTPDDPSYSSLWGMAKIQAPAAWDLATGQGVVVAVVDTGLDRTHPDLAANAWVNPEEIPGNGIDDDGNGYVDDAQGWNFVSATNAPADGHGHGTHVSGTIAAVRNNGVGVVGVAPSAQIMAIKGLGDDGSGYDTDLAEGILYAADNGADVLNLSWGGPGDSPIIEDAINYAHALGVVIVVAAGNSTMDASQFLPAKYTSVITVSAFNSADGLASFSNFGSKIDIAAPGVSILSTVPGGYYSSYNGTSMASPHVAGLAALILSKQPTLTNEQVRQVIRQSADDILPTGFDTSCGYGRINAYRALQAKVPPTFLVTFPSQSAVAGGSVVVEGSADGINFLSRRLEYGVGATPTSYVLIQASTTPVTAGPLGTWNTSALPEGTYSLRLAVTDLNGSTGYFTVSPISIDHTAPKILSATPAPGATLPAFPTTVSATATDANGIARLEFSVDNGAVSSAAPTEFSLQWETSFLWDISAAGAGSHLLRWTAVDRAGNETSWLRTVTTVNDTTPPTVTWQTPSAQNQISGTVPLLVTATDNVGVEKVLFSLDGAAPFAEDTLAPFSTSLSTLGLSLGTHTLTATAKDVSHLSSSQSLVVDVVAHTTPPAIGPIEVTVSTNSARLQWATDEPANAKIEYGTTIDLGAQSPRQTAYQTSHEINLSGLSAATTFYFRAVCQDAFGNEARSPIGSFLSSDVTPPLGQLTSPADGAVLQGTVWVEGNASDENTLARVDLLVDGHYWATVFGTPAPQAFSLSGREGEDAPPIQMPQAATTTWRYEFNTTQLNDGPHTLTARAFDSAGQSQDDTHSITLHNGSQIAQFDPVLGVPVCSAPGAACSSGGLLEARSTFVQFPEPNHPNTVLGACSDGSSGRYHTDESSDWIRIASLDGSPLKAGTLAQVDVKAWAYSTKNNYLDLYVTSNLANPTWTHVTTLQPTNTRNVLLSSTFTLPTEGQIQAVRANFRYQGTEAVCSNGDYDDHDDLAFAVEPSEMGPPLVGGVSRIEALYPQPHPIMGGEATLRAQVEASERVIFQIYSVTGQKVLGDQPADQVSSFNGLGTYEFLWKTDGVAAGTYYWTVEAIQEGKSIKKTRKIAVVN